jgi:ribosome-associated protein
MEIHKLVAELNYKAVRSSGAGGQNVNKVSSKVVLTFDLKSSQALTEVEKILLKKNLSSRLTSDAILILNCDEDRSQLRNKDIVTKRFLEVVKKGLFIQKSRKETRVPKSAIRKRIKNKKSTSQLKQNRRKPDVD